MSLVIKRVLLWSSGIRSFMHLHQNAWLNIKCKHSNVIWYVYKQPLRVLARYIRICVMQGEWKGALVVDSSVEGGLTRRIRTSIPHRWCRVWQEIVIHPAAGIHFRHISLCFVFLLILKRDSRTRQIDVSETTGTADSNVDPFISHVYWYSSSKAML